MRRSAAFILSLLLSAPVAAGTLAGVTMPEKSTVEGENLVLNGMALRKKAIFKVYVGGLYLPAEETSWKEVLASDSPRRMVMQWVRSVDQEAICDGWYDSLEANVPNASADLKADFDRLCEWMTEVDTGDRFVFTYVPGKGTEIDVVGETKGTIESKEFADALFSSWIGEHPGPGEDFRADLMGGGEP